MTRSAAAIVRDTRTRAGLSRRALAAKAGVPISTISRIEQEQTDPTVGTLERLIAATGSQLHLHAERTDRSPTLAELATAVDDGSDRVKIDWTRLRAFADWASRHPGELGDAIADPPTRTSTPLDEILAAFAEELADQSGIPRPRWTRAVGPRSEPWAPPGTPRMLAEAEAATPEPFRRRRVTLSRAALFRPTASQP